MFLTTIRVRRARSASLDAHITNTTRLQVLRQAFDCVEVFAHGEVAAIASITTDATVAQWEWIHPDLLDHVTEATLTKLVEPAIALMHGAEKAGFAAKPAVPEASPRRSRGGRRAEAQR